MSAKVNLLEEGNMVMGRTLYSIGALFKFKLSRMRCHQIQPNTLSLRLLTPWDVLLTTFPLRISVLLVAQLHGMSWEHCIHDRHA